MTEAEKTKKPDVDKAVLKDYQESVKALDAKNLSADEYVAKIVSYADQLKTALASAHSGAILPESGKWCCNGD